MDQVVFMEANALPWSALVAAALLSLLGAVVVLIAILTGSRVHPLLAGLGTGPLVLGIAVSIRVLPLALSPVDSVYVAAGLCLMAPVLVGGVGLIHGGLAGLAGSWRSPRSWGPALGIGALGLGVAVVPILGGLVVGGGTLPFGIVRAIFYALLALLLIPALARGGAEDHASPEAGASAGLAFAAVVGAIEAGVRGVNWFFLAPALASLPTLSERLEALAVSQELVLRPSLVWHWITVLLAVGVALASVALLARTRGRLVLWLGALWLLVGPAALLLGDLSPSTWEGYLSEAPRPDSGSEPGD